MYTCPKCNYTRWKTKVKGKSYQCRNCGHIVTKELDVLMVEQEMDKGYKIYPEKEHL